MAMRGLVDGRRAFLVTDGPRGAGLKALQASTTVSAAAGENTKRIDRLRAEGCAMTEGVILTVDAHSART